MLRRPIVVRRGPGLIGTMARTAVVAGTATAVVGGMRSHQQAKAQAAAGEQAQEQAQAQADRDLAEQNAQMQQQLAAQQAQLAQVQQAPPPAAGGGDLTTKLAQLADLKAAGVLSDEEFAAAKAKLLGA